MSTSFRVLGNTINISANATSQQTSITTANGTAIGEFMVDNVGANAVFVNFGYANTTAAAIANATSSTHSFAIPPLSTKYIKVATGYNQQPANIIYVAAISSGTANVYITPISVEA